MTPLVGVADRCVTSHKTLSSSKFQLFDSDSSLVTFHSITVLFQREVLIWNYSDGVILDCIDSIHICSNIATRGVVLLLHEVF